MCRLEVGTLVYVDGEDGSGSEGSGEVHFSSMSCRWPGLVRSATVLLKSVMNSP